MITCILLLYCCFGCIICVEELHDHDHDGEDISRENIIDEIAEHLGANAKFEGHTVFAFKDVEKLFTELHFKNCTNSESLKTCNTCFSAQNLWDWYQFDENKNLSEKEFEEISKPILYFLISHYSNSTSAVCKKFTQEILSQKTSVLFKTIINKYGAKNSNSLNEENLEQILIDVNKTVGNKANSKKCFTVDDVIKGTNVSASGVNEHEFKYVSSFIILKLLDRICIELEDHTPNLPPKDEFIGHILLKYGNKTHMTHENFEALVSKLNLGSKGNAIVEDDHSGHNHRRRRSTSYHREKRSAGNTLDECYSGKQLLKIFSIPESSTLNGVKFQEVCPSLIQQLESGACNKSEMSKKTATTTKITGWQPWLGAIIANLVISLGSLTGIIAAPLNRKTYFSYILMYLICLAVATLMGDAILHLFPHSMNLHQHDESAHEEHGKDGENEFLKPDSFLWKCLLFLAGVYLFFVFEILMHAFTGGHGHSHNLDDVDVLDQSHKHLAPTDSLHAESVKGTLQLNEDAAIHNRHKNDHELIQRPSGIHKCEEHETHDFALAINEKDNEEVQYNLHTGSVASSTESTVKTLSIKNFRSVVWMVLIGDAIHNFMDGVAIGVAFSEPFPAGLHGGVSTSIAILCHELPHELGDFAILISSGLTIKQALAMNFISSLTSFAGALLGVSLGTTWNAAPWIFAITAGLFIYIALVDMLPEVLHNSMIKERPWFCFLLQNLGLMSGFLLMFILAAWEEDIKGAFK